ncbi:MAG TPA: DUF362 domain-containing protein [Bryobacteraceae bacterium]|nr:DUF362 domain-containing protein [Bryobacteraceae bacterium]
MRFLTTRRDLLMACLAAPWQARATPPSRVAIAREPMMRTAAGTPDSSRVLKALDRAVEGCCGGWHQVARPGETVGLKVNCLAGRGASTRVALVEAICERLQQAGTPARNIVIWDRLNADLESAGFRIESRAGHIRCLGNDALGYGGELAIFGSAGSLLAKAVTEICDVVINLPVMKDHGIVGVTMALKNAFGAIHNPNKYHTNAGDPYVADVNMFEPIRRKMRLHICDAMVAQYEGGPSYMPQWAWPENALLVSRDPVALDYTGWQIIERKRAEKGLPTLKAARREPVYIASAADAAHRLGTNDPRRIEQVEV